MVTYPFRFVRRAKLLFTCANTNGDRRRRSVDGGFVACLEAEVDNLGHYRP